MEVPRQNGNLTARLDHIAARTLNRNDFPAFARNVIFSTLGSWYRIGPTYIYVSWL